MKDDDTVVKEFFLGRIKYQASCLGLEHPNFEEAHECLDKALGHLLDGKHEHCRAELIKAADLIDHEEQ